MPFSRNFQRERFLVIKNLNSKWESETVENNFQLLKKFKCFFSLVKWRFTLLFTSAQFDNPVFELWPDNNENALPNEKRKHKNTYSTSWRAFPHHKLVAFSSGSFLDRTRPLKRKFFHEKTRHIAFQDKHSKLRRAKLNFNKKTVHQICRMT